MIWNNKRYIGKPVFVKSKEDSLIQRHRRWYSQFYTEHSPRLKMTSDLQDWWTIDPRSHVRNRLPTGGWPVAEISVSLCIVFCQTNQRCCYQFFVCVPVRGANVVQNVPERTVDTLCAEFWLNYGCLVAPVLFTMAAKLLLCFVMQCDTEGNEEADGFLS